MQLSTISCLTVLLLVAIPARSTPLLKELSHSELEQHLEDIDNELSRLAHYSPRSGAGAIGYRSDEYDNPEAFEWVQIELEQAQPIDQIVLVPALWRNMQKGFTADGFPVEFQIIAGTPENSEGTVIRSFTAADRHLPRIAPLIISCATTASWVRVEATELSIRHFDRKYNLELAEIILFNGSENVALHRPVTLPEGSTGYMEADARQRHFLVDGFVPYIMNAGRGAQCRSYIAKPTTNEHAAITIDLKRPLPINRIHLHAVDVSDTAPQSYPSGYALPDRLLVEGANRADFSDAVQLTEYHKHSVYDAGPIIVRRFKESRCRYVRLTALEPYTMYYPPTPYIGFSEVELFSAGQNVALHKPVSGLQTWHYRLLSALTDGSNIYGQILPLRQWMHELARRHELETARPLVDAELKQRYQRQKDYLRRLTWLAAILTAGMIITILVNRLLRMRHITKIRERLAADLHDELGANISTIGILSELVRHTESREEKNELLDRLDTFTVRSDKAVHHCTNMLESGWLFEDLGLEMERAAGRILNGINYVLDMDGREIFRGLKPRIRGDLFLFYKECLSNIVRHAAATEVQIQLTALPRQLTLTITDNGTGLPDGTPPPSLRRRARLLGAALSAERAPDGGTRIVLKLKTHKWKLPI